MTLIIKNINSFRLIQYVSMMVRKYPYLLIGLFITSCNSSKVISKKLPTNPTSYVFKVKIAGANGLLQNSILHYHDNSFAMADYRRVGDGYYSIWTSEAKAVLAGDRNKYDLWMEIHKNPSDVYFNKKEKPLEYEMTCKAHFVAINDSMTRVEIQVFTSQVHVRDRLLPSPPHFVNNPIYRKVPPTTIEEYIILQCFGKALGVFDQMPPLDNSTMLVPSGSKR